MVSLRLRESRSKHGGHSDDGISFVATVGNDVIDENTSLECLVENNLLTWQNLSEVVKIWRVRWGGKRALVALLAADEDGETVTHWLGAKP